MTYETNRSGLLPGLIVMALAITAPAASAAGLFGGGKAGTETEELTTGPVAACQGKLKASIAISRFDNKVRNSDFYRAGVGDAMADQLTTALVSTGCYKVVDRQNLKGVMDEMGLQNSGLVDPSTASRIGKVVGADLIVTAAVTEFMDNSAGSRAAAGGGAGKGGLGAIIGGLRRSQKKAHMAVDLRITDVQTSEIIGASAVKGTATDVNSGALLGAIVPGAAGLGALEEWENTPRGAALRQVIDKSVESIYTMIPDGYFRHQVGRFAAAPKPMGGGGNAGGSAAVRKAQQALKDFGIYSGTVDGLMGPQTAAAIRSFQAEMGLAETGKLDIKTMKEIRSLTE